MSKVVKKLISEYGLPESISDEKWKNDYAEFAVFNCDIPFTQGNINYQVKTLIKKSYFMCVDNDDLCSRSGHHGTVNLRWCLDCDILVIDKLRGMSFPIVKDVKTFIWEYTPVNYSGSAGISYDQRVMKIIEYNDTWAKLYDASIEYNVLLQGHPETREILHCLLGRFNKMAD